MDRISQRFDFVALRAQVLAGFDLDCCQTFMRIYHCRAIVIAPVEGIISTMEIRSSGHLLNSPSLEKMGHFFLISVWHVKGQREFIPHTGGGSLVCNNRPSSICLCASPLSSLMRSAPTFAAIQRVPFLAHFTSD